MIRSKYIENLWIDESVERVFDQAMELSQTELGLLMIALQNKYGFTIQEASND